MSQNRTAPDAGDRLAKVMARSGVCSRRDAETWIAAGRVSVNGKKVITPAFNVTERDTISVDGKPLPERQGTRVWLYHKPAGLVVTEKDPEGRPTVFDAVQELGLPRVLSVGRLDLTTEGLLLLTNDGGLKRVLELPETGWLRRYRVRAHGSVNQSQLDMLAHGLEVEGVRYGSIEAKLEREQGSNVWLTLALREGKNREVRNVLEALGLTVNRLIRVSYGPFQLGDIAVGAIETVKARVLKDQLGNKLAEASGADFDSEMPEIVQRREPGAFGNAPRGRPVAHGHKTRSDSSSFQGRPETRRAPRIREDDNPAPPRRIHFDDGETATFTPKPAKRGAPGDRPERGARPDRPERGARPERPAFGDRPARGDAPPRGARPQRSDGPPGGDRPGQARSGKPFRQPGAKPRTPTGENFERPRRPRTDDASGGQADGRQTRPYRGDRPDRPAGAGAPVRRGPREDNAGAPRKFSPGGARPPRQFDDAEARPRRPAPRGASDDRPAPRAGARPGPRTGPRSDAPYAPRNSSPRPAGASGRPSTRPEGRPGGKPSFGKPSGGKTFGDRPDGGHPAGGKPAGGRPGGSGKPYAGKPGGKPFAGRPGISGKPGGRPSGGRPPGGPRGKKP